MTGIYDREKGIDAIIRFSLRNQCNQNVTIVNLNTREKNRNMCVIIF